MSDCCSPGTGFPNAPLMQQLALNHPVIWEEICMIQQAILAAASQCQVAGGQMCTTVGGHTPMTFISGVQTITVNDGGTGYFNDTPSVEFVPPIGVVPTIPAVATVTTNENNILSINIVDGGQGYQPVPATMSVSSLTGFGAVLEPLVNASGQIIGVNIVNAGTTYTTGDTVIATRAVAPNAAYVNATFSITAVSITGEILSIAVLHPGSGYQPSVTELRIVSTLDPVEDYPLGTGFYGYVFTDPMGVITQVAVENTGYGYATYRPFLVITDVGTGATTSVNLTGTSVDTITVLTPGSEYTSAAIGAVYNPLTGDAPTTYADVSVNVLVNTFNTDSNLYWQVWAGTETNKQIQMQLNQVLSYFKGLGYSIVIQTNPETGSTIRWKICW